MKTLQFLIALMPVLIISLGLFLISSFDKINKENVGLKLSINSLNEAVSKIKIEKVEPIDLSQIKIPNGLTDDDKLYLLNLMSRPLKVEMSFEDRQKTTDFLLQLDPAMYKEHSGGSGKTEDIKIETPIKAKSANKITLSAGKDAISK
jgi:hypothetical protein